nr:beta-N-acetylhexosaminidase [Misgurnus anguillicaudatus]XP_055050714.1 beta-N-acetylhexosaminidase [Misgurnus anguillicaudatus]
MNHMKLMKLIVACLVVVAMVKFFFSPSGNNEKYETNSQIIQGGNFWARQHNPQVKLPESQDAPVIIDPIPESRNVQIKEELPFIRSTAYKVREIQKIIHLDLKGAPPKVKYFEEIFPLFSSLGATGILLEYEDMFPYEGELEILRSKFAYSVEDIEQIKSLAKRNQLEIIPLVQVFGHLEFVLKHEKFFHLREVASFPNSLNSLAPGGMELVKEMLSQVMRKHREARWFHIGADEVRGLGDSEDSKRWLEVNHGDKGKLFLNHVTAVGRFMVAQQPQIRLILWDDMFRKLSPESIKESDLHNLASPMIWNYDSKMDVREIGNLIFKYELAEFQTVWFASAFKGASGVDQIMTPINHHLQNHLRWQNVIESMAEHKSLHFQGIALTGWQRYEHHTVLCELLPVGIPSLAVCLQALKHGAFNDVAQKEVQHMLGCEVELSKNECKGPTFPGAKIYEMVKKINSSLGSSIEKLLKNYHIRGSFSPYHRKRNFANPRNLGFFKNSLKIMLDEWDTFLLTFRRSMEDIFFPDTLEEWMEENVNEHIEKLHQMVVDVERIIKLNGQAMAEPAKMR